MNVLKYRFSVHQKKKATELADIQLENLLELQVSKLQNIDNSYKFPFLRNKKVLLEFFSSKEKNYRLFEPFYIAYA